MMLSLAIACRSRGAPVSDWRPAPHVEKKDPMTMTQGEGHARVPTTRFPLTESPNLQWNNNLITTLFLSHITGSIYIQSDTRAEVLTCL